MKQSTKRFFSLIVAFVLVVGALVAYFNFIQPVYQEAQKIKAQVISRESFVQNQQAAISQVKKSIGSYKGEGQLQDVVSLALPLSPDLAGAFAQLTGLIQNNQLALQGVTVSLPVMENLSAKPAQGKTGSVSFAATIIKPFGVVTFQARIVGSYENFKAFMKNLESNIRILDIQKITFQPAGKPDQNLFAYDLVVSTYYQGP